ncbi:phenylacetaldoxime dehydratase family protein [Actinomycetospora sp. DW7H6]|uniref:Phenylacetaldoxime dehydratase family protein n=1 Tax=Actinomycetospora lemnae TaxID=3019891 RepID=A0ABT5T1B2_9PSEU|nr:phenylacetaldoxime dehydratase family protein [Actinomycetospora sp. DW7H6]MDD7968814.1 phenylacetaldoxime dehydratase family protein [Actinomycetospora sp. DW7H6]
MESAIDRHLRCPRTLSRRASDDYRPPFPIVVARAREDVTQVVMAYLGVQYRGEEHRAHALETLRRIVGHFGLDDGPGHHDATHHTDAQGRENLVAVGYWRDPERYRRWAGGGTPTSACGRTSGSSARSSCRGSTGSRRSTRSPRGCPVSARSWTG